MKSLYIAISLFLVGTLISNADMIIRDWASSVSIAEFVISGKIEKIEEVSEDKRKKIDSLYIATIGNPEFTKGKPSGEEGLSEKPQSVKIYFRWKKGNEVGMPELVVGKSYFFCLKQKNFPEKNSLWVDFQSDVKEIK